MQEIFEAMRHSFVRVDEGGRANVVPAQSEPGPSFRFPECLTRPPWPIALRNRKAERRRS